MNFLPGFRPAAVSLAILAVATPVMAAAPMPSFRAVTIDDQVEIGYGLALADVDGDGRTDIVLADKQVIAWYRNPEWQKAIIAEKLTELDNVCVAARDIDGDGRAEIAVGAGWNPSDTFTSGALFYLQPPGDRVQKWDPIRLAHDPTMHRIRWARNAAGQFELISVPLHGRGNRNGQGDGVRILAYHLPVDLKAAWTTSLLNDDWHAAHNFDVFVGGNSSAEYALVAAREGIFWISLAATEPRTIAIATNGPAMNGFPGAGEVRAGRAADKVAFVTAIEPMHGNLVTVYRPPAVNDVEGLWQRQVIDETLAEGHGLVSGDFLGLGRDQIAAGWRAMNRPGIRVGIRLYVAEDDSLTKWTPHLVDDNGMACEDLQAADLDGDGDLDLVASGRATKNLKVYFNETTQSR